MVDALQNAGRVLAPGGRVVDIRPALAYKPTIFIRREGRRVKVGPIIREPDPDDAAAARAVRHVVRAREFAVVHAERPKWVATYADLADVERTIAPSEIWRLPAVTRREIRREWRAGDVLEITRQFSLIVLRRR
jgi:hypothetical protein